jgi:hypothetical protein
MFERKHLSDCLKHLTDKIIGKHTSTIEWKWQTQPASAWSRAKGKQDDFP